MVPQPTGRNFYPSPSCMYFLWVTQGGKHLERSCHSVHQGGYCSNLPVPPDICPEHIKPSRVNTYQNWITILVPKHVWILILVFKPKSLPNLHEARCFSKLWQHHWIPQPPKPIYNISDWHIFLTSQGCCIWQQISTTTCCQHILRVPEKALSATLSSTKCWHCCHRTCLRCPLSLKLFPPLISPLLSRQSMILGQWINRQTVNLLIMMQLASSHKIHYLFQPILSVLCVRLFLLAKEQINIKVLTQLFITLQWNPDDPAVSDLKIVVFLPTEISLSIQLFYWNVQITS